MLESVARSSRVLGFEPTVHFEGPIDALVPDQVANQVLAVLREALSNVARHAAATRVEVTLRADNSLLLHVIDDGTGVPPGPGATGDGLRNIVRRAQELGGIADFAFGSGRGTTVEWIVPLTGH